MKHLCYEGELFFKHRNQEEESLRAAIALSKQDTLQGDEEEGEGSDEPPTTNGGPDLLLDFGSTGEGMELAICFLSLM